MYEYLTILSTDVPWILLEFGHNPTLEIIILIYKTNVALQYFNYVIKESLALSFTYNYFLFT